MAITSKPSENPEFALLDQTDPVTGENNVSEPPTTKKNYGWSYLEKPAHNWMNWLHRKTSEWLTYFDQFHSENIFVIKSQNDFNSLIERVSANVYKLDDNAYNAVFLPLTDGYKMSGALSGGDTWGYIQTNNCTVVEFKIGAFINFENERGYIEVNTNDCYLKNVEVRGTGTVASAITFSFKLGMVSRVTFDNCRCSKRLSNIAMSGFSGYGDPLYNRTARYINCVAHDLDSSNHVYAFNGCDNMSNCMSLSIGSTFGNPVGFYYCNNLSSCSTSSVTVSGAASTSNATGFLGGEQYTSCIANDVEIISTGTGEAYGFRSSNNLAGCKAEDISHSNSGTAIGFYQCDQICACSATDVTAPGGTAEGFKACNYVSSVDTNATTNSNNDYVDTSDAQITNQNSCRDIWT